MTALKTKIAAALAEAQAELHDAMIADALSANARRMDYVVKHLTLALDSIERAEKLARAAAANSVQS